MAALVSAMSVVEFGSMLLKFLLGLKLVVVVVTVVVLSSYSSVVPMSL